MFIKLTMDSGKPALVNLEKVRGIRPAEDGGIYCLHDSTGQFEHFQESFENVCVTMGYQIAQQPLCSPANVTHGKAELERVADEWRVFFGLR